MMRPILASELKNLNEYELGREEFRRRVIEVKKRRRISLGPVVTVVFENRDTVAFQIQEMLRVERIVDPAKIQEEVNVYNAILPGEGEVAATLFIEVREEKDVKPVLDSFIGLDEGKSLWLETGGQRYFARFEGGHGREDRISAVHYVRFPLGTAGGKALSDSREAVLRLEHGDYRARAVLPTETIGELLEDLSVS
jgi:hypothetical protein